MKIETITVSRKLFNDLLEDSQLLRKLRAAGIDNWEGYSEALSDDDESEEDIYGEHD